jgi:tetratricopeptide (TPR) repeat protein
MYFRMDRLDDAIRLYKKALAANPRLGLAHYFLGFALFKQKEYTSAWEHARQAKELGVPFTILIEKLEKVAPENGKTE